MSTDLYIGLLIEETDGTPSRQFVYRNHPTYSTSLTKLTNQPNQPTNQPNQLTKVRHSTGTSNGHGRQTVYSNMSQSMAFKGNKQVLRQTSRLP